MVLIAVGSPATPPLEVSEAERSSSGPGREGAAVVTGDVGDGAEGGGGMRRVARAMRWRRTNMPYGRDADVDGFAPRAALAAHVK